MYKAGAIPPQPLRSYLAGLTLSRSSATAIGIAAGFATDSANAASITLGAFTKSTAGAWAAGTGANGMGNGVTVGNGTWYHVFAIINAGLPDAYIDTSITAANKPTGTTAFRRLGSFKTDGSAQILAFTQDGDDFVWATTISEVADTNPGTNLVTVTLAGVPTGVTTRANLNATLADSSQAVSCWIHDLSATDVAATQSGVPLGTLQVSNIGATYLSGWSGHVRASTAAQIGYRCSASGASTVVRIVTNGWRDRRGQDA